MKTFVICVVQGCSAKNGAHAGRKKDLVRQNLVRSYSFGFVSETPKKA